jgi:hypothetical protein
MVVVQGNFVFIPRNFSFFIYVNIIQFDARLHEFSVDQNSIAKQNHMFEGKTEATLVLVFCLKASM